MLSFLQLPFLCRWLPDIATTLQNKYHLFFINHPFSVIFLRLLGWHRLTKPYRFQIYNSTKYHLHTAPMAQSKFSSPNEKSLSASIYPPFAHFHLPQTPFPLAITILLSESMCIFFLNTFTLLSSSPIAPPFWQLPVCSIYLCYCFYLVC